MKYIRNVLTVITVFVSPVIFLWATPAASSEADWKTAAAAASIRSRTSGGRKTAGAMTSRLS